MSGPNDPHSPDYSPKFTGGGGHGDVGSGRDFGADLYALYAAGRIHLPDAATSYSNLSARIHDLQPYLARMVQAGASGVEPLLDARETVQIAFVKTSNHLAQAGEALLEITDDYLRTDEDALENFNSLRNDPTLRGENNRLDQGTGSVPTPTRPDAPHDDLGSHPHGSLPGTSEGN